MCLDVPVYMILPFFHFRLSTGLDSASQTACDDENLLCQSIANWYFYQIQQKQIATKKLNPEDIKYKPTDQVLWYLIVMAASKGFITISILIVVISISLNQCYPGDHPLNSSALGNCWVVRTARLSQKLRDFFCQYRSQFKWRKKDYQHSPLHGLAHSMYPSTQLAGYRVVLHWWGNFQKVILKPHL